MSTREQPRPRRIPQPIKVWKQFRDNARLIRSLRQADGLPPGLPDLTIHLCEECPHDV